MHRTLKIWFLPVGTRGEIALKKKQKPRKKLILSEIFLTQKNYFTVLLMELINLGGMQLLKDSNYVLQTIITKIMLLPLLLPPPPPPRVNE